MRKGHFPNYDNETVSWSTLKELTPYLTEFKFRVFFALLFMIAAKVASVYVPLVFGDLVDTLGQTEQLIAVPLGLLLMFGALRFLNVLLGEVRDTLFGRVTERAMRRIGLKVFKHLHQLDLNFHLSRQTGGLSRDIERGTSGISFLLRFMIFNIGPTILEIAMIASVLVFNFDVWFAVIIVASVILYALFTVKATEWRTDYVREANQADSKSNTQAVDSLLNYETVKYFNNEDYEAKRYDHELKAWESARRKNRLSLFVLNGGQAFIIALANVSMLVLAAHHVVSGNMTVGGFTVINMYMLQLFLPLNFLGFVYREMKGSMANIEKMFELLRQYPTVKDATNADTMNVSQGKIEFNNVEFNYDNKRNILNNVSFKVNPGEKVAVVGSSGAGKSTIVKLLFRFYDTTSGSIVIDNQNIKDVTQESLRQHIGIVPQDTVLFNSTIWDNIKYGDVNASDDDIYKAIKLAHLNDFIESLPEGVNTLVGERGLKLSGGEKQRVAIARTILKKPPILLFDEATSSLDSKSEQVILDAINEVSRGHTSLVIAHRLSTVVDADKIIVLNEGQVVEQGTHAELLDVGNIYFKLWSIQQKKSDIS